MRNIHYLIILIFISCKTTDKAIKKNDTNTLFVLFEESKETIKRTHITSNKEKKDKGFLYSYSFSDDISLNFSLDHSAYFSFDDMFNNTNRSKVLKINKKFLKNNFIITSDYIKKLGDKATFKMFYESKTIFLIDKSEIKNNTIILREVKPIFTTEE